MLLYSKHGFAFCQPNSFLLFFFLFAAFPIEGLCDKLLKATITITSIVNL